MSSESLPAENINPKIDVTRGKGFRYCQTKKRWLAYFSARHPISKQPFSRRRMADSKEDAIRLHRKLKKEVQSIIMEAQTPSWSQVVTEYMDDCRKRHLLESTILDYGKTLRKYTNDRWRNKRICDVREKDVSSLMNGESITSLSLARQEKIRCFLNRAFNFAIDKEYIFKNPCNLRPITVPERQKSFLNEAQAYQLLNSAKETGHPWYEIWSAALYTGMRTGELYALRWEDVDFTAKHIKLNLSWSAKKGIKGTKSNKNRIVPIAPAFLELLKELKIKTGDSHLVLPRAPGWKAGKQAKVLKEYLLSINLPPVRFQDLRASWVTILVNLGLPLGKIMEAGGWENLETMDIYLRSTGINVVGITDDLNFSVPPSNKRG